MMSPNNGQGRTMRWFKLFLTADPEIVHSIPHTTHSFSQMTHMPPPTRLLRQILSIGDDMENLSRLHLPSTTLSHTAIEHYPPCPLPRPQPLYTELINLGLENNIAKRISDKSLQSALDLRACAEASMHEAIAKTTTSRHPDLQSAGDIQHSLFLAYKRTYLRMIAQWKEGIIKMATKQCSPVAEDIEDTPQHLPRSRRDFNYVGAPLNYEGHSMSDYYGHIRNSYRFSRSTSSTIHTHPPRIGQSSQGSR